MLYIVGVCERCKEIVEVKLDYVALEKNADVSVQFALYHKPRPINRTVCGGRVRIVSVSDVTSDETRTMLPLELWQAMYEQGASIRVIAAAFTTSYRKVHRELFEKHHSVCVVRRQGRPSDADLSDADKEMAADD